tara:strand:+ start:152 stop:1342 length:1191 start_codon:yes stop_codon:yes gene_type:complete
MSQINVDAIRHTSASSDAITLASNGKCAVTGSTITADTGKFTNLPNRNLIINGAMNVAQRGTSSTTNGYGSVDRWKCLHANTDEAPTSAQHALTSSDTGPWAAGFRNSFHITNGNQTSGLGDPDYILFRQVIEAQNIANSGWNYTSASSYLTLSFWVKSSVAQNFYGTIRSKDGTSQNYPFETGSLTADTWTKITKTIPGNANLTFDNNSNEGMEVEVNAAFGGDYTDAGVSLNTWAAYASATINPVNTATWYTTNDSTFEITGVQLEVGDYATDFEHRSYGDEFLKCQRYFTRIGYGRQYTYVVSGIMASSTQPRCHIQLPTTMRASPTITEVGDLQVDSETAASQDVTAVVSSETTPDGARVQFTCDSHSAGAGQSIQVYTNDATSGLDFSAEL